MKHAIRTLARPLAFFGTLLLGVPALAQQITRTDWQMFEDKSVFVLDKKLTSYGAVEAYVHAKVPAENDPKWKPAPDGKIINFGNSKASVLGADQCRKAVNYTYFQTIVDVPAGARVNEFKINFVNMDDGVRITIFNSGTPRDGTVVVGSYVEYGGVGTSDLRALITSGRNRVVVTQVDTCPTGNRLGKAEVVLNGQVVTVPVKPEPFEAVVTKGDGTCGASQRPVAVREVKARPQDFCKLMGEWEITRLADGGSLSGSGYKCEIKENDTRQLGSTLCARGVRQVRSDRCVWFVNGKESGVTTIAEDLTCSNSKATAPGLRCTVELTDKARRIVTLVWDNGNTKLKDVLTLSADEKVLEGKNNLGDVIRGVRE